ncbi:transketolase [bacterium]|nr:transketolase [bacterium]
MTEQELKNLKKIADTVKVLALSMINNANSGHSGIVLSAADILCTLFQNHLVLDPNDPNFFNRDRFIMDPGHGSALLYALMYVYKVGNLKVSDLMQFRQIDSITPGHPESFVTSGVEYSTGALGQGCGASVGFACAQAHLNALYPDLVNHYTYCLISDGAFEEGISYEAFSVAAKAKLNKLIFLYDANNVQLDSMVSVNTITNKHLYFESLGLNYIYVANGHDFESIDAAIKKAKECNDKPSIIEFNTVIGKGTNYENINKAHGLVLSKDELNAYKEKINFDLDIKDLPPDFFKLTKPLQDRGQLALKTYHDNLAKYQKFNKEHYQQFLEYTNNSFKFDSAWFAESIANIKQVANHATRDLAHIVLQKILVNNPVMMLTNPDLSSSTKIFKEADANFGFGNYKSCNVQVGVREFVAMAIINGMIAHKGVKGITAGFLTFSDYNKHALRVASMSSLPTISVFSHDSIAVGEDGPSHQPIEQINSLRLIPNLVVFRPCNIDEMLAAFQYAITSKYQPTCIITSRQAFKNYYSKNTFEIKRGGYVFDDERNPDAILIATGSEIALAMEVKQELAKIYHLKLKVVSFNSMEVFNDQPQSYQEQVLSLPYDKIFSLELGSTGLWYKYAKHPIGIDSFGKSGKQVDVLSHFHLTVSEISQFIVNNLQNK